MPKRRVSILLRGQFTHEEYRRLCDALDEVGEVYNSMGNREGEFTFTNIYLNTRHDQKSLEALIRDRVRVEDLVIHMEKADAENCN